MKEENIKLKKMLISMHKRLEDKDLEIARLKDQVNDLMLANYQIEIKFN